MFRSKKKKLDFSLLQMDQKTEDMSWLWEKIIFFNGWHVLYLKKDKISNKTWVFHTF